MPSRVCILFDFNASMAQLKYAEQEDFDLVLPPFQCLYGSSKVARRKSAALGVV